MQPAQLTVVVLFGTRPELIKLAPVIKQMDGDERFRVLVVSTSQHREQPPVSQRAE